MDTKNQKKVVFLITKSNWGENKNYFLFSPVPQATTVVELARQVVGGPSQFYFVATNV